MGSEADIDSTESVNDFVATACRLLKEYAERTLKTKSEFADLVNQVNSLKPAPNLGQTTMDRRNYDFLIQKVHFQHASFERARKVYEKLIRKVSQWLEHGKPSPPGLQLELEIRLADLEYLVNDLEWFMGANL